MEPIIDIPYCPIPPETMSDVVPMGIIIGLFVLMGWLFRKWKKSRGSPQKK